MDPVAWGPPLWALLHTSTLGGDAAASDAALAATSAMCECLPCCKCRASLRRFLPAIKALPMTSFQRMWMLHNAVNRKLGKPELPLHRARLRWSVSTVDPIALLDALLIVAYNYRNCKLQNKLAAYRALWEAVGTLCSHHCALTALSAPLRAAARAKGTGSTLACKTNALRNAVVTARSCGAMVLTSRAAAKHFALARAGSGRRPAAKRKRND